MVNCDILIRTPRKTLTITVDKTGKVIVKAPIFFPEKRINEFLAKKSTWIEKNKARIGKVNSAFANIISLKSILYFGNECEIIYSNQIKRPKIVNSQLVIPSDVSHKDLPKNLLKWFQKTAKVVLAERLSYFLNLSHLACEKIMLTNSKSKWGSCSSTKRIALNPRILCLNSDEQDYILVHEMCHLLEMNHSKNFYACIESILPNYKKCRDSIKNSSFILNLYRN